MGRSDTTWLNFRAGLRDILLQEHHRPYDGFDEFPCPTQQTPQMITIIGQKSKTSVMRKLRLGSSSQVGKSGEVHLRTDPDTVNDESPLLLADCEMHSPSIIPKVISGKPPGDIIQRALSWHRGISQALDHTTLAHLVYTKLLAPFSTVILFFADDLGGLTAVAEILALWLMFYNNRPLDLPQIAYPRVLILTQLDRSVKFDELKATRSFMQEIGREAEKKYGILAGHGRLKKAELDQLLAAQFGGMRVIEIPSLDSPSRLWKPLKARILGDSTERYSNRQASHVAFSAYHFKALFSLATEHFCVDIVSPFNFIRASRIRNPLPGDYLRHLCSFLSEVDKVQILNFAVPIIASAFVFESYPPGMHDFLPSLVFEQLFRQKCLNLNPFGDREDQDSHTQFTSAVEIAFCQKALAVMGTGDQDGSLHRNELIRFKSVWKEMYSNTTCYSCLARSPENTLDCHHSLCTPCTMTYGSSSVAEPWTFWPPNCPLCDEPNEEKFVQKPDTAGIRSIIVEGGGVRGMVPLSFLTELEAVVALPMGIQEHFDIAFGSSSGALIILGLFSNQWSVKECLKRFQLLSTLAFRKRRCFQFPQMSTWTPLRVLQTALSFATDSRYSSSGITQALVSAFGDEKALFESSCRGAKVAVVAATTEESSTCIFTNYNGPQERSPKCGYKLIRPTKPRKELLIWQAARASSAAPPYFKPFEGYQDGGLGGHNNPINLALWEQDAFWSRQKKQPDIVLSLGTGFRRVSDPENQTPGTLSFLKARYVPRLFRSFLNFFVGETRWQELQNSLTPQDQNRYHRLNVEFYGDEPELDDLQAMPNLLLMAKYQAASNDDIQKCADNVLATLFYLKLTKMPTFDRNLFLCKGHILCRIGPSHRALRALTNRLTETQAHFYLDFEQKLPCLDNESASLIEQGLPFSRAVMFKVVSLEDSIDIKIDGITQRARSISNCPYKIETLIKDQRLDCVFGSRNSRKRPFLVTAEPWSSKRVRLGEGALR